MDKATGSVWVILRSDGHRTVCRAVGEVDAVGRIVVAYGPIQRIEAVVDACTLVEPSPAEAEWAERNLPVAGNRKDIFDMISGERQRQDEKWGAQDDASDSKWLAILVEEVGEVAQRMLQGGEWVEEELVQCAAVIVAWLECRRRR